MKIKIIVTVIIIGLVGYANFVFASNYKHVAYYPFNGNAEDASGSGNHAQAHGAVLVKDRFGNPNQAYRFDGRDDYLALSKPLSLFSGSFTVSMWVQVPSNASGRVGVLLGDYGISKGLGINFEIHNRGQIRLYWSGSADLFGKRDLRDNQWHHIVFIRDKKQDRFEGYVDGAVDIRWKGKMKDRKAVVSHRIGRDSRAGDTAFEGTIDDIRIYNRIISPKAIGAAASATKQKVRRQSRPLFDNWNTQTVSTVSNMLSTQFIVPKSVHITRIENYHWNNGNGKRPGKIGLIHSNGTFYGPWQAKGAPGQGGGKNAIWVCQPKITIPAGTYTVFDSDPHTWSQNTKSGHRGFSRIKGY